MKNHKVLSTLFVGIDVGSIDNEVCAIDFDTNRHLEFSVKNNQTSAVALTKKLVDFLKINGEFSSLVIAMESTYCYGTHISTFCLLQADLCLLNHLFIA